MLELLWLIPALPFAGFLALVAGERLSRRGVATIGVGSVGAAAAVALALGCGFAASPPPGGSFTQVLWNWISSDGFAPQVALYLDPLSLVMTLVVTFVGFLIHLYSAAFMAGQGEAPRQKGSANERNCAVVPQRGTKASEPKGEGYRRFFACMNLFVGSMLILVLADNLLLLYLGWEGVGLCSYLLIGFWHRDPANGRAAMKAFIVTRIGDASMAVALFLLFASLGDLRIQELARRAAERWEPGCAAAVAAAALLLGGAVGKSAQLPLQTWLPDAMAGPTPVSALIHAATMVTAGVYLIARTHVIFELAPQIQGLVALIGAATLILAGLSALVQKDIKRVLAYSTMSQIGYMFLALGVGAWGAAIFHFATHAFFKSLLFLSAGVVIAGLGEEHDMFKMGGLRKDMPATFWTFLAGAFALASLPPATAGFSKELILSEAWAADKWGAWLFSAGLVGAFVTSLYTFRMVFLTFFGERRGKPVGGAVALTTALPLILLAFACVFGGLIEWPAALGGSPRFVAFLQATFAGGQQTHSLETERLLASVAAGAALAGAIAAYFFFLRNPGLTQKLALAPAGDAIRRFWLGGWGFDWLYEKLIVAPFVFLARLNKNDFIDLIYGGIARLNEFQHGLLAHSQTGHTRWYAMGLALGAIAILLILALC